MNQNLFIVSLILLTSAFSLSAQEENSKPKKTHEIGVNATFFISQFISFSSNSPTSGDVYAVSYKIYREGKRRVPRMGLGLFSFANGSTGTDAGLTQSRFRVDARVGTERQFKLSKKWQAMVGGDFRTGVTSNKRVYGPGGNNTSSTKDLDLDIEAGLGPVLGIQFNINSKISIFTESAFIAFYERNIEVREAFNNSESDDWSFRTSFALPSSIYFAIKF